MDAVTEVLLDRTREADKVTQMVVVSLVAHAVLVAAAAFVPNSLGTTTKTDEHVMNISLAEARVSSGIRAAIRAMACAIFGSSPGPRRSISVMP